MSKATRDFCLDVLARWMLSKGVSREARDREMARLSVDDRAAVLDRMEWIRDNMRPDYDEVLDVVEYLTDHYMMDQDRE